MGQIRVGDTVQFCIYPGEFRPMIITRVWSEDSVNGFVLMEPNEAGPISSLQAGVAMFFVSSVPRGSAEGNWREKQ